MLWITPSYPKHEKNGAPDLGLLVSVLEVPPLWFTAAADTSVGCDWEQACQDDETLCGLINQSQKIFWQNI